MSTADHATIRQDVKATSDRFYAALTALVRGNAESMKDVWVQTEQATTGHPMATEWIRGWRFVFAALEEMSKSGLANGEASVAISGSDIVPLTADVAYEVGIEDIRIPHPSGEIRFAAKATNVYLRQPDGWRMVHHHVDRNTASDPLVEQPAR